MTQAFEAQKNRKAMMYTIIVCATLLLLFIIIRWKTVPPTLPVVQDLIEINLGNEAEGWGEEQPLIKGKLSATEDPAPAPAPKPESASNPDPITPDDNAEATAAPVNKPSEKKPKLSEGQPKTTPAPAPQKPKLTYKGPENGKPGNNETEDNSYRMQGDKKGKPGDKGVPTGNKDSYGDSPKGRVGGPRITKGNRKIVTAYSFPGDLNKATIYAIVRVSPSGTGRFVGFDKGSTSRSQAYADAISSYLRNISFNKTDDESTVTVQFNFTIN